jgi:2-phospho-L-lactate guanylyltransferase
MDGPLPPASAAVLVPVKAFSAAKARLTGHLSPAQRASLARAMAERVLAAGAPLPVFVVCDDAGVRSWAAQSGAQVIWSPGRGLNGAVTDGVASLADQGFERVVVAHADLPYATSLAWLSTGDDLVTIVPDRHDDGTNVICVPARSGFGFAYGPGSARNHEAEARRLGLAVRIERDDALGWDVDLPRDLVPELAADLGIDITLLDQQPLLEEPCP